MGWGERGLPPHPGLPTSPLLPSTEPQTRWAGLQIGLLVCFLHFIAFLLGSGPSAVLFLGHSGLSWDDHQGVKYSPHSGCPEQS